MNSTRKLTRLAGLSYFIWMLMGIFSLMYVPSQIFVAGDTAATASNLVSHEFLFRSYIVVGLLGSALWIILALLLYRLLEPVDRFQARLMMLLVIVQIPAVFIFEAFNLASLMAAKGELLKTLELSQRQDLAVMSLKICNMGNLALELYWGLWLFPLAILVYRSRFLPRFIGVWLGINGVAYVILCAISILLPQYKDTAFTAATPAMFGEAAFALWMLIRGANTKRLVSHAAAS